MSGRQVETTQRLTRRRDRRVSVRCLRVAYSPPDVAALGEVYPLTAAEVWLGRHPEAAESIAFDDPLMSRSHARVCRVERDASHILVDAGSTNGTRLNGERIERAPLKPGDVIRIGDTLLTYGDTPMDSGEGESASRLVGDSPAIQSVVGRIQRVAPSDLAVLVLGESGTGKELVARELHERSGRKGAFLAANCAAIPGTLIDSELFGHVKGAFSGATTASQGLFRAADGGTIFLDEIGELAPELQSRLLRILETGEVRPVGSATTSHVDVRVISATNVDLDKAIDEGRFRGDLFARLDQVRILLPPLRERREDVLPLFRFFRDRESGGASELWPDPDAAELLVTAAWRYNVRELEKTVRVLLVEHEGVATLTPDMLPTDLREGHDVAAEPGAAPPSEEEVEAALDRIRDVRTPAVADLHTVLVWFGGNVSEVAQRTGRDRRQVYRWMERFGLRVEQFRV